MSLKLPAISTDFVIDTGPGFAAEDQIVEKTKAMAANVDRSMAQAADSGGKRFKGMLKDVSAEFGKKSNLGLGLKLLAGGGAVAGLNMAFRQFGDLGDAIGRAADAMRNGDAKFHDLVHDFLAGTPILGGVIHFVEGLREAWTGEAAAEDEARKASQRRRDEAKKNADDAGQRKDAARAAEPVFREATENNDLALRVASAPEGLAKEREQEYARFQGDLNRNAKDRQDALKAATADNASIMALQKDVDDDNRIIGQLGGEDRAGQRMLDARAQAQEQLKAAIDNRDRINEAADKALNSVYKLHDKNVVNSQNKEYFDAWKKGWEGFKGTALGVWGEVKKNVEKDFTEGKSLHEALRTPEERINESFKNGQRLLQEGAITPEDFQRQLNGARDALQQITSPNTARLQAEEVGGHTTVTAADQGEAIKESTQATADGVQKLVDLASKQPSQPTFVMVTMPG